MRLATCEDARGMRFVGIVVDEGILPLRAVAPDLPESMAELAGAGTEPLAALVGDGSAQVGEVASGRIIRLGDARLLAPVPRPGKVIAAGLNYRDHAAEQGVPLPRQPLLFAKFSSSVIGPGEDIVWDPDYATQVDAEAELAVVIGRRARHVTEEDALDHVFGYTVANDVSARDMQSGDGQWTRAKSLDTFCPLGPWIVTADQVPDPQALRVSCTVNGDVRQDGSTRDMVFGVARLISYASRAFTLEPGDVILTGTPAGVGIARKPPLLLGDGDEVTIEIEGIGALVNRCRALTPARPA